MKTKTKTKIIIMGLLVFCNLNLVLANTNMVSFTTNTSDYSSYLIANNSDSIVNFRLNTIGGASFIIIGPVTICTTNGKVVVDPKVTIDEASSNFWKSLERAYPYMFPNYEGLDKSNPPKIK